MTFVSGYIEMGGGGAGACRVPDILYHIEEHWSATSVPNYGTNQAATEIYPKTSYGQSKFFGTGTPIWPYGEVFPGPRLSTDLFMPQCKSVQMLVAFEYAPYFQIQQELIDPGAWWLLFPENNTNTSITLQAFTDKPPYSYETLAYTNPRWSSNGTYGPNNRTTVLLEFNMNNSLDALGPETYFYDKGMYYHPGQWLAYRNGLLPTSGLFGEPARRESPSLPIFTDYPLPCNYFPVLDNSFYIYAEKYAGYPDKVLGYAVFRDQPKLSLDEFMCWHMDYDWTENPGFI